MNKIIRKSSVNVSYATPSKKQKLDELLCEYKRVVNIYIDKLWTQTKLPKFTEFKVETWLSARLQQCAGKQATQIIKSVRKKDRDKRYKRYKKVYKYFKKQDKQKEFLNKRFSELKLKWKIKPVYKADVLEFDSRFADIQEDLNSFDLWIKLSSLGNKLILKLPSKKHKHYHKFKDWKRLNSARLRKQNGQFYIDVFFEKEAPELKQGSDYLAIDLGINTLFSLSNGWRYGTKRFKKLLQKLNHKKQKSKRWYKTIQELKNYISQMVKKLGLEKIDKLILEELKNISRNTRKERRVNKTTRKYLSKWNRTLIYSRIENICELNGVQVAYVNPAYTSQTCSKCGFRNKGNRNGEKFKCLECGYKRNADLNAAKNLLQRFCQELIVPDLSKE